MTLKPRKAMFQRLKAGLEDGVAHARGELTLREIEVPDAPPEIDARTLAALRKAAAMSQAVFAKLLFVSPKTVQSWEQGGRVPSLLARRLIQIFAQQPETVCRVVGLPAVQVRGFKVLATSDGRRRIVIGSSKQPVRKRKTA
jgi:putative transcriptional regulator